MQTKKVLEVPKVIRQIQDKYDWPKKIDGFSGDDPYKLLDILSILKYKFTPSVALQTLTPKVLKNIKRKNISFKDYIAVQKKITQTIGENTSTEPGGHYY